MRINEINLQLEIKRLLVKLQNYCVLRLITNGFLEKSRGHSFVRLGSSYGGWNVDSELLSAGGEKVLISAGLGHDVSFDLAMLEKGFKIIGLDPLKSSFKFAKSKLDDYLDCVDLINSGLWLECKKIAFYAPKNSHHDSWSINNVQETEITNTVEFSVVDLDFLYKTRSTFRDATIRILKMDIEGAEEQMFNSVAEFQPKFSQVSIEMDFVSLVKFRQVTRRINAVRKARFALNSMREKGYYLYNFENFNFTWLIKE